MDLHISLDEQQNLLEQWQVKPTIAKYMIKPSKFSSTFSVICKDASEKSDKFFIGKRSLAVNDITVHEFMPNKKLLTTLLEKNNQKSKLEYVYIG